VAAAPVPANAVPAEGKPGQVTVVVKCPQNMVGRVIGKGGETVKSLQQMCGAHVDINQNFPQGEPREVIITGAPDKVRKGEEYVHQLIHGGADAAAALVNSAVGPPSLWVECPKDKVGRVIGKGGETVKNLQQTSGARIQIDQSQEPCRISVAGPPNAVETAQQMLNDIISGGHYQRVPGPGVQPVAPASMRPQLQVPMQQPGAGYAPMGFNPYSSVMPNPYGGASAMAPQGYPPQQGMLARPPPAMPGARPPMPAAMPQPVPPQQPVYPGYPPAAVQPPYAAVPQPVAQPQVPYQQPAAAAVQPASYASYGGYSGYATQQPQQPAMPAYSQPAAAKPAAPVVQAGGWETAVDGQGRTYYYNRSAGISQWTKPAELP